MSGMVWYTKLAASLDNIRLSIRKFDLFTCDPFSVLLSATSNAPSTMQKPFVSGEFWINNNMQSNNRMFSIKLHAIMLAKLFRELCGKLKDEYWDSLWPGLYKGQKCAYLDFVAQIYRFRFWSWTHLFSIESCILSIDL